MDWIRCGSIHGRGWGNESPSFDLSRISSPPVITMADGRAVLEVDLVDAAISARIPVPREAVFACFVEARNLIVAFLENSSVVVLHSARGKASWHPLSDPAVVPGGNIGRELQLAASSSVKPVVAFCKRGSPSVWLIQLDDPQKPEFVKLKSEVSGFIARTARGLSSRKADQVSTITSLEVHRRRPWVAAAYENGVVRVWDMDTSTLFAECDVQITRGEQPTSIAFHPVEEVLAFATNAGTMGIFKLRNTASAKGAPLTVPSAKASERGLIRSVMFLDSRTIVAVAEDGSVFMKRIHSETGKLLPNYAISRSLSGILPEGDLVRAAKCEMRTKTLVVSSQNSQEISLFRLKRARDDRSWGGHACCGVSTPFSLEPGRVLEGPVTVRNSALFVVDNTLYSYSLEVGQIIELCTLPSGPIHRISASFDIKNEPHAAIIIFDTEEPSDEFEVDSGSPSRYLIASRTGKGEKWNTSEPQSVLDAIFLGPQTRNDSILLLSSGGKSVSTVSFGESTNRGVQREKLTVESSRTFRAPFNNWYSVAYWLRKPNAVALSNNWLGHATQGNLYNVDDSTRLPLRKGEVVTDLDWQAMPKSGGGPEFLGYALTNQRIILFADDFRAVSVFPLGPSDFIQRPWSLRTALWIGPCICLSDGDSVRTIAMDGGSSLLMRCTGRERDETMIAALPDRLVFVRRSSHADKRICLTTRTFSRAQVLVQGLLELPSTRSGETYSTKIKSIFERCDMTQISTSLIDVLADKGLSELGIALVLSPAGELALSRLDAIRLLTELGSLRNALTRAEDEYRRLPMARDFHQGTELYRNFQLLCNQSFLQGEFEICRRCARILGRAGVLSAFKDREGGLAAIHRLCRMASEASNAEILQRLTPLVQLSEKSSIAVLQLTGGQPRSVLVEGSNLKLANETEEVEVYLAGDRHTELRLEAIKNDSIATLLESSIVEEVTFLRDPEIFDSTEDLATNKRSPINDSNEGDPTVVEPDEVAGQLSTDIKTTSSSETLGFMERCYMLIDQRNISEANFVLEHGVEELGSVGESEIRHVANYRFFVRALSYLMRNKSSLSQMAAFTHPMQLATMRAQLAHIGTALTVIPGLLPRHHARAVQYAVGLHMEAGNFGYAAQGIQSIAQSVEPSKLQDLQRMLMNCQSQQFRNQSILPPGTRVCFFSISLIPPGASVATCSLCPAVFSPVALLQSNVSSGRPCPICSQGFVC
mmetsp:Transcript_208/g.372  ORF Transcript_208/g.372 Transcript_208/m.372 type:complete len:1218 (-) Transcript_208:2252-5905(-)